MSKKYDPQFKQEAINLAQVLSDTESILPTIEIYSIDEAFADITGLGYNDSFHHLGAVIQKRVKAHTHLNVGVGIAPTKTLAKLANHAAKIWTKTQGVVDLSDKQRQIKLMKITPIDEVWGIGKALSIRLKELNIKTAFDLACMSIHQAKQQFSVVLERTIRELNGESCLALYEAREPRQQIICSRSFGQKVTNIQTMSEAISHYTSRAAEKLREDRQYCQHLTVFIKSSPFSTLNYTNQASENLIATNDTRELLKVAKRLLNHLWLDGIEYQKAGVILNHFCDNKADQYDLFASSHSKMKSEKLMQVIDNINHSQHAKVYFAPQGTHPN